MFSDKLIEEVKKLWQSRTYVWLSMFFIVLAYGYFATNSMVGKDWLWFDPSNASESAFIAGARMSRWAGGFVALFSCSIANSNFISCIVGLSSWFFAATLILSFFNRLTEKSSGFYGALFVAAFMCSGLYVDLLPYPNMIAAIGIPILAASAFAILSYEFYLTWEKRYFFYGLPLLIFVISGYEVCFTFSLMALGSFFFVDYIHNRRATRKIWFFVAYLVGAVAVALVLKAGISALILCATGNTSAIGHSAGAAKECIWQTGGIKAGIITLGKDCVREFGFRALCTFSSFVGSVSLAVWMAVTFVCALRNKSIWMLAYGLGTLIVGFAIVIATGNIAGTRIILPMVPFVTAVLVYEAQFLKKCRWLYSCIIFLALVVYAEDLSLPLNEACDRYAADVFHARMINHDLAVFPGRQNKPVVFIGELNSGRMPKEYFHGLAYNFQVYARPRSIERRFHKYYMNGGYVGQSTLLSASENRREELYVFMSRVDAFNYSFPDEALFKQAEEWALKNKQPSYPLPGYIAEMDGTIVVNLGMDKDL